MTHTRKYRSGMKWAFCRWTDTPSNYITRLHLISTPMGAICLHWINASDPEPWLHDHPVSFLSIVLKGWYRERRDTTQRGAIPFCKRVLQTHRWWNYVRASRDDIHSITHVAPGGCLTLCFMGPKRREWGFHTDAGWEYWKDYNARVYGKDKLAPVYNKLMAEIIRATEDK